MKILVTGRHGQLVRSLGRAAPAFGVDVVAVGLPAIDLTKEATILASLSHHRPDVVINAAAFTEVDDAEDQPEIAHAVNALGAEHVAQSCNAHGIPMIQISTNYVFDGAKLDAYCEDDAPSPINVYGRSKREGEIRVARACERHVILRTAWLYSPWRSNFVKSILRLATTQRTIGVVNDQQGSPTSAQELADVCLAIAARVVSYPSGVSWGTYHATAAGTTTWFGFAEEVMRCAAERHQPAVPIVPISTDEYPARARRPANGALACDKLLDRFGLQFSDWRAGVRACVVQLTAPANG